MLDREILTKTIAGCRDVLRHQTIYWVKIIPKFIPRQLRAVKAMGYSAKPRPIPHLHMEAVTLLNSCDLHLYSQLRHLHMLPLFPLAHNCPAYACPMDYITEGENF